MKKEFSERAKEIFKQYEAKTILGVGVVSALMPVWRFGWRKKNPKAKIWKKKRRFHKMRVGGS